MVATALSYLTQHRDEIVVSILSAIIIGVLVVCFKHIKSLCNLMFEKTKRLYLNARPKVCRAFGVTPTEDHRSAMLQYADLEDKLVKVQAECAKLVKENSERLRQQVDDPPPYEMRFRNNVYWRYLDEDGLNIEGPFCPKCLDGDRKEIRLAQRSDDRFWRCPVCHTSVEKPGQRPTPSFAEADFDPFSG
jgi:hypothetical protein